MKIRIFKIIAAVFVIGFVFNYILLLYLNIDTLKEFKNKYGSNNDFKLKEDEIILKREREIEYYLSKVDSLIDINPFQAELFIDKLLKKYKNNLDFIECKAVALAEQNKFKEAIKEFKYIEKKDSSYADVKTKIGICYENFNKLDSAIFYYHKEKYNNEIRIANCHEKLKNIDSAKFYYQKLFKDFKNNNNVLSNIEYYKFLEDKIKDLN